MTGAWSANSARAVLIFALNSSRSVAVVKSYRGPVAWQDLRSIDYYANLCLAARAKRLAQLLATVSRLASLLGTALSIGIGAEGLLAYSTVGIP